MTVAELERFALVCEKHHLATGEQKSMWLANTARNRARKREGSK